MSPRQKIPGQMTLDVPRNLHLMFHQNWVRNSWDIADMDKCRLDKYHHDSWYCSRCSQMFKKRPERQTNRRTEPQKLTCRSSANFISAGQKSRIWNIFRAEGVCAIFKTFLPHSAPSWILSWAGKFYIARWGHRVELFSDLDHPHPPQLGFYFQVCVASPPQLFLPST